MRFSNLFEKKIRCENKQIEVKITVGELNNFKFLKYKHKRSYNFGRIFHF